MAEEGGRKYFVRNEQGRVFGPLLLSALQPLASEGSLKGKLLVSVDGEHYSLPAQFPDFCDAMLEAQAAVAKAPRPAAPAPPPKPKPVAEAAPPPPSLSPEPKTDAQGSDVLPPPEQGTLAQVDTLSLYARAAAGNHTGLLSLQLADRTIEVHFRKGNPEYVHSSHPEDAVGTFLIQSKVLNADQLGQAEAAKERFGGELVAALFGLAILQPATAFGHLAQRAQLLLYKALLAEAGTFRFEAKELPPFRVMPLGNRWSVLGDLVRRIPSSELKRRLLPLFELPMMKSGGWVATSDLRLLPQEARALGVIDGVRSIAQLLQDFPKDADSFLRLAFMLKGLEALSFAAPARYAQTEVPPPEAVQPEPATKSQPGTQAVQPEPVEGRPRPATPPGTKTQPGTQAVQPGTKSQPGPQAVQPGTKSQPGPQAVQPEPVEGRPRPAAPKPAPAAKPAPSKPGPPPTAASLAADILASATTPGKAPASIPTPKLDIEEELVSLQALRLKLKGQNHFERLGLTPKTDNGAVKMAYFKLAKLHHPDTVPAGAPAELEKLKADIFGYISEAYRALGDEAGRAQYSDELANGGAGEVDVRQILMAEELFQKSTLMVKARRFPDALKLLEEAIQLNPDEPEFYAWRGYARYFTIADKKEGFTQANKDLQLTLKRNERCAPAHFFLGQLFKLTGDNASALKAFRRTVELQPDHIDAQREVRMANQKK